MLWAIFSILTALTWAAVSILDKYVVSKWFKNPFVSVMFLGIVSTIASFLIYVFYGFSELSFFNIAIGFFSGTAYVLAVVFYFKAVEIEEISRVVPLVYMSPIFTVILAGFFLGEIFTPIKYFGIFLLLVGAIAISSKKSFVFGLGKAFWFMVLTALFVAITAVTMKYLLQFADYWTVFSYTRGFGMIPAMIFVFYYNSGDFISAINARGKKAVFMLSSKEALRILGSFFIVIATSLGPVTLATALASVQPFFVLAITVALSLFYPRILKEEIGKDTVLFKIFAIVLIFVGAFLIV